MLRSTGICDEVESGNNHDQVEAFCNRVAGFALIPRDSLADVIETAVVRPGSHSPEQLTEVVRRRYRTSRHVAAIRLEADRHIPTGAYNHLAETWAEEDWRPRGEGGPVPVRYRVLSEKGTSYSTLLISAWKSGLLSSLEASRLLEVKTPYLAEVADELRL
jgi:Zn-dependent peptidase ImmA (M78 family)